MSSVKVTTLKNGIRVSTVSLKNAHPFVVAADKLLDPLLGREHKDYETLVFPPGCWTDIDCIRDDTEADALLSHAALCAKHETEQQS